MEMRKIYQKQQRKINKEYEILESDFGINKEKEFTLMKLLYQKPLECICGVTSRIESYKLIHSSDREKSTNFYFWECPKCHEQYDLLELAYIFLMKQNQKK